MLQYTPKEIQEIALNMRAYGGSFMRNLGEALLVADYQNTKKILSNWAEDCAKYLKYSK